MNHPCSNHSTAKLILSAGIVILASGLWARPAGTPPPAPEPNLDGTYDIRVHGRPTLSSLWEAYGAVTLQGMAQNAADCRGARMEALARLRKETPSNEVRIDPLVESAELVLNRHGFLTAANRNRSATDVALAFLRSHAAAYGVSAGQVDRFEHLGESQSPASGLRMVRLHQTVRGLPVFQADTRIILDQSRRLIRTVSRIVPDVDESRAPRAEGLSAAQALAAAMDSVHVEVDGSRMELRPGPGESWDTEVVVNDPRFPKPVSSRLTYFPLGPGVVVPAWEQVSRLDNLQGWYTVVDLRTGTLLYRKNTRRDFSRNPARFDVYARAGGAPLESAAPGNPNYLPPGSTTQFPRVPRTTLAMLDIQDPVASPNGWIPDNGDTTMGNNVDAFIDSNGTIVPTHGQLDEFGRARGNPDAFGRNRDFLGSSPRSFDYSPPPLNSNPDAGDTPTLTGYQRGAVTNVFYLGNYFHDRLYRLGFDEAAGNYQQKNFQKGGKAGDPVRIGAQAGHTLFIGPGGGVFFIAPDGTSGDLALPLWGRPSPDRDADLDAEVSLHELTHGVTTRILGDAAGLNWTPGAAMGEGWSDFFALALTHGTAGDDPLAQYSIAPYVSYKWYSTGTTPINFLENYVYGIRRFPVTVDNSVNPLTWADADPFTADLSGGISPSPQNIQVRNGLVEIHEIGEIWSVTLWEVRSRIIAAHGGDVSLGNDITLQIVTDALKLTPPDPGYIDARDAILDGDCAANNCANEESIWGGFADRGLGYGAGASLPYSNFTGVSESFALPHLDAVSAAIHDDSGNLDGFLDPGETVSLRVQLMNPWRDAAKGVSSAHAVLSSTTPGVTISDNTSDYGAIPAQGITLGGPFTLSLAAGAPCGSTVELRVDVTSALGASTTTLRLRVGRPSGMSAPVTFSRTIPGGLAIPDGNRLGVTDSFAVDQDLQIADLDFQVDSLIHPYVGNLILVLKGPVGLGMDLIAQLGACFPCTSSSGCRPGQRTYCDATLNDGDNFIGTRIDDNATQDLFAAGPSAAPFTGSWLPYPNSPSLTMGRPPSLVDPVGQLSHFNGGSTFGTWRLYVVDYRTPNAGTLNSWSVIVNPVAYHCGP